MNLSPESSTERARDGALTFGEQLGPAPGSNTAVIEVKPTDLWG
jgi:hypothetical protein